MTLNDERVQFYLRHRDQLEEWFALRREAAAAIGEWLIGLRIDLRSLVAELGDDIRLVQVDDSSLYLKRSAWPGLPADDATLLVGIQWPKGKTYLYDDSSAPYVGVRGDRNSSAGRALSEDL